MYRLTAVSTVVCIVAICFAHTPVAVGTYVCSETDSASGTCSCPVTISNGVCGTGLLEHFKRCTVQCNEGYGIQSNAKQYAYCINGTAIDVPTCHSFDSTPVSDTVELKASNNILLKQFNKFYNPDNSQKYVKYVEVWRSAGGNTELQYLALYDENNVNLFLSMDLYPSGTCWCTAQPGGCSGDAYKDLQNLYSNSFCGDFTSHTRTNPGTGIEYQGYTLWRNDTLFTKGHYIKLRFYPPANTRVSRIDLRQTGTDQLRGNVKVVFDDDSEWIDSQKTPWNDPSFKVGMLSKFYPYYQEHAAPYDAHKAKHNTVISKLVKPTKVKIGDLELKVLTPEERITSDVRYIIVSLSHHARHGYHEGTALVKPSISEIELFTTDGTQIPKEEITLHNYTRDYMFHTNLQVDRTMWFFDGEIFHNQLNPTAYGYDFPFYDSWIRPAYKIVIELAVPKPVTKYLIHHGTGYPNRGPGIKFVQISAAQTLEQVIEEDYTWHSDLYKMFDDPGYCAEVERRADELIDIANAAGINTWDRDSRNQWYCSGGSEIPRFVKGSNFFVQLQVDLLGNISLIGIDWRKLMDVYPSVFTDFPNSLPRATFAGVSIPYPFRTLQASVETGKPVTLRVDGTVITGDTPVSFGLGPTIPELDTSRFGFLSVNDKYAHGHKDPATGAYGNPLAITCGDGVLQGDEECDDGNEIVGDGCDNNCKYEDRFSCSSTPLIADTAFLTSSGCAFENTCGNNFIDRSNAFATQQHYRRIPFSQISGSPDNNLADPNTCAVKIPSSSACSSNAGVTFTIPSVKFSQIIIDAGSAPSVRLWNGDCGTPDGGVTVLTGTGTHFEHKFTPASITCVMVVSGVDVYSVKMYESIGDIEECDGESYCDSNCQLIPTAYCNPRPEPIPELIFSARRSHFEYNVMFSGQSSAEIHPQTYSYSPHLKSSSASDPIARSVSSGKSVVAGSYDIVGPASGGLLYLGANDVAFTAFVKMTGSSAVIATFKVNHASAGLQTLTLSYLSGQFVLSLESYSQQKAFGIDAAKETFIAIVFGSSDINAYFANEGDSALSAAMSIGWQYVNTNGVSFESLKLKNLEYMTMMSFYTKHALNAAEILAQFSSQDEYGSGLLCSTSARPMDGVVNVGEACDDGNKVDTDGCKNDGTVNTATPNLQCEGVVHWNNSVPVSKVTFTGVANVEEIVFYDAQNFQIKPSTNSGNPGLHDGIFNTPGDVFAVAFDVNAAEFTFDPAVTLEYIRMYNSRHNSHDSNQMGDVSVSINDGTPFKVGHATEWNGGSSGPGGCVEAKYLCYADLVHDATQSQCTQKCNTYVEGGVCKNLPPGQQYINDGESCELECSGAVMGTFVCNINEPFTLGPCVGCNSRGERIAVEGGHMCICDVGFHGLECELDSAAYYADLGVGYGAGDLINPNTRVRHKFGGGPIDSSDDADAKVNLAEQPVDHPFHGKAVRLGADFSMPALEIASFDMARSNLHMQFPDKDFGVILKINTQDGAKWDAPAGKSLKIRVDMPTGYDVSTMNPLFGFFVNQTSGTLEKMPTSIVGSQLVFEVTHFSLYVVDGVASVCGNSQTEVNETCDDGNTVAGDGCSDTCTIEAGYVCTGNFNTESVCTASACGDGFRAGAEACDDGDTSNGDGCSSTCTIENGWQCTNASCTAMQPHCGDGQRVGSELNSDRCDLGGMDPSANIVISGNTGTNQYYTINGQQNPTLYLIVDQTYTFDRSALSGHPFQITNASGFPVVAANTDNTFTFTPSAVGTYTYVCTLHGTMTGSIIVQSDNNDNPAVSGCGKTCSVNSGWAYDVSGNLNPICGDGNKYGSEECDDENTAASDGCSSTCTVETGWDCSSGTCISTCGDGHKVGSEACDDSNTNAGDGCSTSCTIETGYTCSGGLCETVCGDGNINGTETCDDGNTNSGDGCSALCTVETGWDCSSGTCTSTCGDGHKVGSEACDDGNTNAGDGCSTSCTIENGYDCTGTPSSCSVVCGDGIILASEECDDGNAASVDGCSSSCTIEIGFTCSGTPSTCSATECGDGQWAESHSDNGEACDGDMEGCASCQRSDGYVCVRSGASNESVCTTSGKFKYISVLYNVCYCHVDCTVFHFTAC